MFVEGWHKGQKFTIFSKEKLSTILYIAMIPVAGYTSHRWDASKRKYILPVLGALS
jgi:hypothetical protein